MDSKDGYRWKILFMAYVCQLSFALVFQSIPPILRLIISELQITHAQAGLLMSLFALPGIFAAIPSGMISDRFGVKKVAVTSLSLMIIGTFLVGVSKSFFHVCVGRAVSGVGAITLTIVLPQTVSRWFMHNELGLGMGVFNTAVPFGTITSFNVLSVLSTLFGWRAQVFSTTIVSVVALLVFLTFFREPTLRLRRSGVSSDISQPGFLIWLVGFAWLCFNAAIISFLTFSQDFFISKGYELAIASFMSSLVMMGSLFLSPVVGYCLSRFGREEVFILVGGAGLASLLFLISNAVSPFRMLIPIAAFVAFVPPPIFSLPSKIVKPHQLGLAFGVLTTCLNIGVLCGPYLSGLAKDVTGSYHLSFYLMSLFSLTQVFAIGLLTVVKRKTSRVEKG